MAARCIFLRAPELAQRRLLVAGVAWIVLALRPRSVDIDSRGICNEAKQILGSVRDVQNPRTKWRRSTAITGAVQSDTGLKKSTADY